MLPDKLAPAVRPEGVSVKPFIERGLELVIVVVAVIEKVLKETVSVGLLFPASTKSS